MLHNDNIKDFRHAVQVAEDHLRREYAWRVGQFTTYLNYLASHYGDGDALTSDSLAHAFLYNYFQHNQDGSLEDCVEMFTNLIRDSAYGFFSKERSLTVDCILDADEATLDNDRELELKDFLLPITNHPIFPDEVDIIDDPYYAIYSHMETLYPEELVEKLEFCHDILEKIGRDDIDPENGSDEDAIEILKGLSGFSCRPDFDAQLCRLIGPDMIAEECRTCSKDCPNKVVIDIKVCPDDGQA